MNKLQIKYTLEHNGISMRAIARDLGVSVQAVSLVVSKKFFSLRIADGIAKAMRVPIEIVFPEQYLAHLEKQKKSQAIDPKESCHEVLEAVNV